ncbi:type II toxin-antitoxin system toxin DNA ADP-ribosyl transferase DarT [Paludibaculum fermentans]|uniref:type II toxin-antitoxin system toxin DNA ADP-ribosyl transferase DarT n=1 Tax=Paludibaculum fermentans TaxID=1473598 RepID=UPI003EB873CB
MAPANPKIYHITHLENLPRIADGVLWSDAERLRQQLDCTVVGMTEIKRRRLEELKVDCHPGTKVGDYVPFYFCPRSVMLYLLCQSNHPDLAYRGGQRPIVHLEADLRMVVDWADSEGRRWAMCKGNAGAFYTVFSSHLKMLDELDWSAIQAVDWRDPIVKDRKQAEFLVHESFPWHLVERIGVLDSQIGAEVAGAVQNARHQPIVTIERNWYY